MLRQSKSLQNRNRWKQLSEQLRKAHPICEFCGHHETKQTHHIVSKFYRHSLLRWDPENLICLCPKCHFVWHKNPIETIKWLIKNKPASYEFILNKLEEIGEV